MKESLPSKKVAVEVLVPFLIGAFGLLSGCGPGDGSVEDLAPESLGTAAQASTLSSVTENFSMPGGFQTPASWPTPITSTLSISGSFDNNGANVTATDGETFSNGDPPLLLSLVNSSRSGTYVSLTFSGTWVPRGTGNVTTSSHVSVYDGGTLLGTYTFNHSEQVTPPTPTINAGGVVNASDYTTNIHRGDYIAIFGSNLSTSTASCYATNCAGTQVVIGGVLAVITYASPGQINAIVPTSVSPGGLYLIISASGALSTPYYMTVQ